MYVGKEVAERKLMSKLLNTKVVFIKFTPRKSKIRFIPLLLINIEAHLNTHIGWI